MRSSKVSRSLSLSNLPPAEALRLVESELAEEESVPLLILKGHFIQLSDCPGYGLDDALRCYERAHELDSSDPEPLEEMGYFHYAVLDDEDRAAEYFNKAIQLGAGPKIEEMIEEIISNANDA